MEQPRQLSMQQGRANRRGYFGVATIKRPSHDIFYETLHNFKLTQFSYWLAQDRSTLKHTPKEFVEALLGIYDDPFKPVTLFVPTDDAISDHLRRATDEHLSCARLTDAGDCLYFLSYHAAPGTWFFDEPNPLYTHTIIPTPQLPFMAKRRPRENWVPNALVAVTEKNAATGALKTTFRGQNVSIVESMPESPHHRIKVYTLDGVLKLPPTYDTFVGSNWDARRFEDLRSAATSGGADISTCTGFTAFVPVHQSQFLEKAQQLFPTQPALSLFYSNHIIVGHVVWSSEFAFGSWKSQALYPYKFDKPENGPWTVSINGIKAKVVEADVALANGVVHFIDTAFWHATPEAVGGYLAGRSFSDKIRGSFFGSMLGSMAGTFGVLLILAISVALLWWRSKSFWHRYRFASGSSGVQALHTVDSNSEINIPPEAFDIDPFELPQIPEGELRRSSDGPAIQSGDDAPAAVANNDNEDNEENDDDPSNETHREVQFRVSNPGSPPASAHSVSSSISEDPPPVNSPGSDAPSLNTKRLTGGHRMRCPQSIPA